ncbi:unnamed protein product, partial [Mesorhabditis belari]|uniref:Uncharacterized protein n=1 Tax=Mesorhabditis belari TaxID=2138241 RepID=A0AAF3FJ33_9BILA
MRACGLIDGESSYWTMARKHVLPIMNTAIKVKMYHDWLSPAPSGGMIERCVVVQRQPDGYGLTVNGDHPVFVHTVRSDGAAFCAGVRQGDRILKVNGMPVTSQNHLDVVRMISGGQTVALTLLGKPPDPLNVDIFHEQKTELTKAIISDPMPVAEKEEWKRRRKEVIAQMLEDERRHVESLRDSSENGDKLEKSLKRIQKLQSQLRGQTPPQQKSIQQIDNTNSTANNINNHSSSTNPWMHVGRRASDGLVSDSENDEDMLSNETSGPFSSIVELKGHPAHLAVFISFLLSNANPNSLFFYLITDAYQQTSASAKELRRWAFEIFTTFVVPNSPMHVQNMDQNIIQPIDKAMTNTAQDVRDADADILRKIFIPARQRAELDIREHLADFRVKKHISNLFEIAQLGEANDDSSLEWKLGESLLLRALETTVRAANPDYDLCSINTQALLSSLATLIKVILCLKPNLSNWERLLEKCPTFVTKDKMIKVKAKTLTKKIVQVKGHQFSLNPVNVVHYCYQCRDVIWAMQPYAYSCTNCDVVIHKQCATSLTDACYPATQGKSKDNKENKAKSRPKSREGHGDERIRRDGSLPRDVSVSKLAQSDSGIGAEIIHPGLNQLQQQEKVVGRSQSMRGRTTSDSSSTLSEPAGRKGRSALSWGTDLTPADEEAETVRSFNIRELTAERAIDLASVSGSSGVSHCSMPDDEVRRMMERIQVSALAEGDSDLDVESEVPPIEAIVGWDVVRHLKPKEKKRQEVINELFHTERTHVRNLKIVHKLFYTPMTQQNLIPPDIVELLFANIDEILQLHQSMNKQMRAAVEEWKRDPQLNGLYGDIGELMDGMFSGEPGEKLREATAEFCKHQQHALEILRTRYKSEKEDALSKFLATAELHPLCRKLQLKDMLPVEMQRLVKYPLLLETVAKYTNEPSEEQEKLLKTVAEAKKILHTVNTAKRNAENYRRLEEIQKRLDTTPFDRDFASHDFASLNLTKYQLVHDGPLTCRFNRGKLVELHAILLDHYLILLTRQGDGQRLQLKCLEPTKESKWAPILPLFPLIPREKANDKRTFFLVFNSQNGAQIYELAAPTATDRKTWYKLICDQVEQSKKANRQGLSPFFDVTAAGSYQDASSDGQMAKVNVLTHPRLVSAKEIRIEQPTILEHAKPILTPTEKLKRADQQILEALADKNAILAQFLPGDKNGRKEELDKLADLLSGLAVVDLKQKDPKELAMAAIVHGNRLLDSINQGMVAHKSGDDPSGAPILTLDNQERHLASVPCYKLTAIAAPLMNHLKAMMALIQEQQNEIQTLKNQVQHYKDLADGGHGLSVSEETLTDVSSLPVDPNDRILLTKRFLPTNIPPQPPPPTSLPPAT